MTKKVYKILSIILLIAMCVSMFSTVVFADEPATTMLPEENNDEQVLEIEQEDAPIPEPEPEPVIEPEMVTMEIPELEVEPEVEVVLEQKLEVEPQPQQVEPEPEPEPQPEPEPEPEIVYPFTVTYHFHYRGANGVWKEVTSSQKVTSASFNNSKAVSFFSKQIINNNFQTTSSDTVIYTWLGTWTGDLGTVSDSDRVYTNTTLFQSTTEVHFYADYSEKLVPHLTFICDDQVAHGSHSAANIGSAEKYHYTFRTPADIPEHYTFLYWENEEGTHVEGDEILIDVSTLNGNVIVTYNAVYKYQPALQVNYHYSEGVVSITEYKDIDIYASAPTKDMWFYADEKSPIAAGTMVILPEQVVTTVPMSEIKIVDVYAKYFTVTWVNEDGSVLEKDTNIPYGAIPSYDSIFPTKKASDQYNYAFKAWTPELVKVTKDAVYTATYNATLKPQPSPSPSPLPSPQPQPVQPAPMYTITYMPGAHGLFQPQSTTLPYGSATPPAPVVIGEEGYQFTRWTPAIGGIVTGNAVFTAQWEKVEVPPTTPPQEDVIRVKLVEDIEEDEAPLAAPERATWALVNLILLVFTIFTLLEFKEDKEDKKSDNLIALPGVLLALALFILTENVYNKMILVDRWTLLQLLFYMAGLIPRLLAKLICTQEE